MLPSWAFQTATARFEARLHTTIQPSESPEARNVFWWKKWRAWIGEVWPRRMKAGTAGECVPCDVISVMMVEDPRRNVPLPQS